MMRPHPLTTMLDRLVEDWSRERPDLDIAHKQIVYAIFVLRSLFSRNADEILSEWKLNFTSYGVIATLRRRGEPYEMAPTDISEVLGLTTGGLSNMLRRLETLGYVRRIPNKADRRGVWVRLTANGRRVVDDAATVLTASEARHLQTLSQRDQEHLYRSLRSLIGSFSAP